MKVAEAVDSMVQEGRRRGLAMAGLQGRRGAGRVEEEGKQI